MTVLYCTTKASWAGLIWHTCQYYATSDYQNLEDKCLVRYLLSQLYLEKYCEMLCLSLLQVFLLPYFPYTAFHLLHKLSTLCAKINSNMTHVLSINMNT